ncbi:MAG: hypothetical protein WC683_06875 [bacterium]
MSEIPGMSGEAVLALRKGLGLSQERMGRLLNVSWHTVKRWERYGIPAVKAAGVKAMLENQKMA